MKRIAQFAVPLLFTLSLMAQTAPPPAQTGGPIDVQFANTLIQLQEASQDANVALGRLRIDKWKTGGDQKQQAQTNADSLQRNLTRALPELLQNTRQNPQDLTVNFKLYRNLSAVYDVLASVTEAAGSYGPREQYEQLAQPVAVIDTVRKSLADRIEQLSAAKETELARLKATAKPSTTTTTSASGVKKIVVDDNTPAAKPKKPKAKPSAATTTPQ